MVTPENTWTALKNSSGHVCDPRCEEVLVLEEMGRKDKIQQKFNPHKALGWFSNRKGTSVDDGKHKLNNWLDQWQSDKLGTGSRVNIPFHTFTDFPVINWLSRLVAKSAYWCQDLDLCPMLVQCSKLNFFDSFLVFKHRIICSPENN